MQVQNESVTCQPVATQPFYVSFRTRGYTTVPLSYVQTEEVIPGYTRPADGDMCVDLLSAETFSDPNCGRSTPMVYGWDTLFTFDQ